jgi:hypothetical protein
MSAARAERLLQGQPLISAMSGSIAEMKALRDRCLAAGIPALVGNPPGACKSCGPKTNLLVQEASLPELGELLRGDWRTQLEREGLPPIALDLSSEELPCPACGTAAPLVGGACSDCGLRLE